MDCRAPSAWSFPGSLASCNAARLVRLQEIYVQVLEDKQREREVCGALLLLTTLQQEEEASQVAASSSSSRRSFSTASSTPAAAGGGEASQVAASSTPAAAGGGEASQVAASSTPAAAASQKSKAQASQIPTRPSSGPTASCPHWSPPQPVAPLVPPHSQLPPLAPTAGSPRIDDMAQFPALQRSSKHVKSDTPTDRQSR
nr:endochitinase A-like [Penaeus vannamei]